MTVKRAYSMWGYEVSACQACGAQSFVTPCRSCQRQEPPVELEVAS